jgi:hypothetical protein
MAAFFTSPCRSTALLLTILMLLSSSLQASFAAQKLDNQLHDDSEAALTDIDLTVPTENQAALESDEGLLFNLQTEWRSDISAEAAKIFAAAVAAQRGIKEVLLYFAHAS